MRPDIQGETLEEPAVLSEELARIVDEARRVPLRTLEVDAAKIHRAWWEHRARRRRRTGAVGLLAAATIAALFFAMQSGMWERGEGSPGLASVNEPENVVEPSVQAEREDSGPTEHEVVLAADVRIVRQTDTTPDAVVLGAREVRISSGAYEITVTEHATASLVVRLPDGHLEIVRGVVLAVLDGPTPEITLLRGKARWIHADGEETDLVPVEQTERPSRPTRGVSPSSLAERADELLARGDREAAIDVLEKLVQEHPNAASARGATLDLARLLKDTGQRERARCAYTLYLERWPYTQLRRDVEAALRQLGEGPDCDGLDPTK